MTSLKLFAASVACFIAMFLVGCGGGGGENPPLADTPAAPSITTQPANQSVVAGQAATFTVTATGSAPLTYQWKKNGNNMDGATSSTYTLPATSIETAVQCLR